MEIYQVGGAVRDQLLGLPVTDRDWVVVGATVDEMLAQGYRQVGKDFPVFLHPNNHEEYALARTERKTAPGYSGFAIDAAPTVTLEQDLLRRDLTINAMAMTSDGTLIDPYGGQQDLQQRLLRHVSPAFSEDPLRILRVARFMARFYGLGFHLAEETVSLMRDMVAAGEVDALVPERIWTEWQRALQEAHPDQFIEVLRNCGALAVLAPEIDVLFGVPQSAQYHPEIDTGVHTLMALRQAVQISADPCIRFAVLVHDLGKGVTPPAQWPQHKGHEKVGADRVRQLCARLRIPNDYRDLASLVAEYHTHCHRALELKPLTLLKTLESLDALRRPQRLEQFLFACQADARGRLGFEQRPYPQADRLRQAYQLMSQVDARSLIDQGLTGQALGRQLRKDRLAAIAGLVKSG